MNTNRTKKIDAVCPNEECGSSNVWRKGAVPSRGGPKARYVCVDCGTTFYRPKKAVSIKPAEMEETPEKK